MKIPSIVIAGTNSGCGKTTITMGIMAALMNRGMKVQPYKVGPDYIDPMFHTSITGRYSRNLDSWLLDEDTVKYLFAKNGADADICVVEGVMGFYDGYGGKSLVGSTAHVARIIGAPVILVINGEAMSLSAAAIVKGFAEFEKNTNIKGVIINNISGESHYRLLKEAIEINTGVAVLGYIKKLKDIAIESRHLGLVLSSEISDLKEKIKVLANEIEQTVDLDLLIKISKDTEYIKTADMSSKIRKVGETKIAVAMDKAFCFYYRDNLELLETLGAKLEFFSPIKDNKLPDDISGIYIGGGYPEIWSESLTKNSTIRKEIKSQIAVGMPVYAECGGLMYMTESLIDKDGMKYEMVGAVQGKSSMTNSLKRFGYVKIKLTDDTILQERGSEIRGHEFHYSEVSIDKNIKACYEVSKAENRLWSCGFSVNNLLAGYAHIHFWSNPSFAEGFVKSCSKYVDLNCCY